MNGSKEWSDEDAGGGARAGRREAGGASPAAAGLVEQRKGADALASENARLRDQLALAEERLRECDERFRTVLDQSIDIVYRRNLKADCYDYISPAIQTVSGYSVAEFSRVSSSALFDYIHPDDHAVVLKRFAEFEQSRQGSRIEGFFEFRLKCKDGGYRWISDSGVLLMDAAGVPLYHVGVARDITERKQIEEALRRSNEELEEKVAERTSRLRRMANELSLAEQRERRRISDYLHDELQQVLVAAKLEAEKLALAYPAEPLIGNLKKLQSLLSDSLNKTRCIMQEFVTPLLYVVGFVPALQQLAEQMARRHGLRVELDIGYVPEPLPESLRIQLFHAVREMLFNVAKHSGSDFASVKLRCANGLFEITVADAGKGFDPGGKLSSAGSGYGLFSISERLAALGGQLSVDSAPGSGARITLKVPIEAEASAPLSNAEDPEEQTAAAVEPGGQVRVLVADDHEIVRRGIIALLSLEPEMTVVGEAGNGAEALALARQLRPDVVVMDIRMPDMDGIEATRLITAAHPDIRVVGVSAFVDDGFRTAMRDAGAFELLDKATAANDLALTIRRCVDARRKGR